MGNTEIKKPCIWTESPNGKGDYYVPSCIKSRVNVIKWAKKHSIPIIDIFRSCPFCGSKVVIK